jgi:hypothetical protein
MASLAPISIDCPICPAGVEVPVRQLNTGHVHRVDDGPDEYVFNLTVDMGPWRQHIAAHTANREAS